MPNFEYRGSDPIDHFWLGHIEPGDVVEVDGEDPPDGGEWKSTKKRPSRAAERAQADNEPAQGDANSTEEG